MSYAFHSERKLHPERFKNQLVNQVSLTLFILFLIFHVVVACNDLSYLLVILLNYLDFRARIARTKLKPY